MTNKADILADIAEAAKRRIHEASRLVPLAEIQAQADLAPMPKDFRACFLGEGYHVIAEVKRASPSRGDIAVNLNPVAVATDYLKHGARALSVLTEPDYFKGSIDFLKAIRAEHADAYLLMKDFFVDEYQIAMARAAGADAILVIMAMLGPQRAAEIFSEAKRLGLTPLVEVHSEQELRAALEMGADLIGINNRDLKTMNVSLATTVALIEKLPKNVTVIGESGIETAADLCLLKEAGCHGFLIGTSFMATGRPGEALAKLLTEARRR